MKSHSICRGSAAGEARRDLDEPAHRGGERMADQALRDFEVIRALKNRYCRAVSNQFDFYRDEYIRLEGSWRTQTSACQPVFAAVGPSAEAVQVISGALVASGEKGAPQCR
jgi:hypothetical protein